ncbi:MAG: DNRLRE domain-containing protein [Verrucomicrobia bacterium]|nr:DNRLRE domain-containing protein [Verrucomicrobiota bacterium]
MIRSRNFPLRRWCVTTWSTLAFTFITTALGFEASAQTVTRGPYLQMGTTSEMTIRWRTSVATNSVVRYGVSLLDLNLAVANLVPTKDHEVRLTGLTADTAYYYGVGTTADILASGNDYLFRTAPIGPKPIRIWAIGDAGTGNAKQAAVRDMFLIYNGNKTVDAAGHPLDLWLMLGDNAYPSGTDANYQKAVFDMYPTLLRRSVVWPTFGNHDDKASGSAAQSGPYYAMFTLPKNGEAGGVASGTEAYYSFDYGNAHFICLNSSDIDRSTNGAMMAWLLNDLAAATNDWLIAFWHHPPYTKGSHNSDTERELIQMRENFLPVLEAHGVDLVLCGHSHSYERSKLLDGHYGKSTTLSNSMVLDPGSGREADTGAYLKSTEGEQAHAGAVYVVAGASGKTSGGRLNHPAMYFSANALGSLLIDINGNRLDVRYLGVDYNPITTNRFWDSFTLIKMDAETNALPEVTVYTGMEMTGLSRIIQCCGLRDVGIGVIVSDADGSVTNVDILRGGEVLGSLTAPIVENTPMVFVWTNAPEGAYTVTARAVDDSGGVSVSRPMIIKVAGPASTNVTFQEGFDAYTGAADTTIMADFPTNNFGTESAMEADGKPDHAILVRWDLSAIPPGKTVTSATVWFSMNDRSRSSYEIYPLTRAWSETEATWMNASNGVPWTVPGASGPDDRSFAPLGALKAQRDGSASLVLIGAGLERVQRWVNHPESNFGFIILDYGPSDGLGLRSRETELWYQRPAITVTYE